MRYSKIIGAEDLGKIREQLVIISGKLESSRQCKHCLGTGKIKNLLYQHVKFPDEPEFNACRDCIGMGFRVRPDYGDIFDGILGRGGLRSARPKDERTILSGRCYYVWRLARFDGGADVTMPVMANMELGNDPYIKELDWLSGIVAKLFFGTHMAGAVRWGTALGMMEGIDPKKLGALPPTAFETGPVLIGPKPESEAAELEMPNEDRD